jgi:hypothetical protein
MQPRFIGKGNATDRLGALVPLRSSTAMRAEIFAGQNQHAYLNIITGRSSVKTASSFVKVCGSGTVFGVGVGAGRRSVLVVALAQPVQKHLFNGFVVGHQHVADRVSAHKMADLLGQVLGVVAGTLQRLSHENDLQAGLAL